jgi:hypothetical protein
MGIQIITQSKIGCTCRQYFYKYRSTRWALLIGYNFRIITILNLFDNFEDLRSKLKEELKKFYFEVVFIIFNFFILSRWVVGLLTSIKRTAL